MKSSKVKLTGILLVLMSLIVFISLGVSPAIAATAADWTVLQLTTDANRHIQPQVSSSRVIWLGADGDIYRVFTRKLGMDSSPVVVTPGAATDANWPKVSGDRIIWQENYGGEFNIYTKLMGIDPDPVLISADSPSYNIWPEISGNRVVWYGSNQVFTRKMGTDSALTQLTDMGPVTDSVQISGDRVVWIAHSDTHDQLFTQKIGTDSSPVQLTTGWDHSSPRVSDGRIVWLEYTNGYKQVFTQKIGTDSSPVQLTNYPYSDAAAPDVSGNRIVWTNNERVFTQKMGIDAQPVQLSSGDAGIAKVSGNRVIWLESDGSNYQLIVQDVGSGDEPVQLSTNGGGQPQISGEYVTWVSNVDGFEQVFVAYAALPLMGPDTVRPMTTLQTSPTANGVGWNNTNVLVTLNATDNPAGSGVASIHYHIGAGPDTVYNSPFTISNEGANSLSYWAIDNSSNSEVHKTATIRIDKTPPTTTADGPSFDGVNTNIILHPVDSFSGVASTNWTLDGVPGSGTLVTTIVLGEHVLIFASTDVAGNMEELRTLQFTVVVKKMTTVSLATKSKTSVSYGTGTTISGFVSASGDPVAGFGLTLQSSSNGSNFSDSATAIAGVTGNFSFSVKPTSRTWYRVIFRENDIYMAGPSATIYITPKVYLTRPYAPTTMYHSHYYTIYGYLKPRHTSGSYPVRIYKYRYVSGHWKSYGYESAKASNYYSYTKISHSVKLPYRGRWRVRLYAPSDSGHSATWSSSYDYVTVR